MTEKKRAPLTSATAYTVAQVIWLRGAQTKEAVLLLADFGHTPARQADLLSRAMKTGWLVERDGLIDLSEYAVKYLEEHEPEPKPAPTGSVATPREIKPFRPMSPQYRVNSRGPRADAPDCSVKAKPSHYAKVTP